MVLLLCYSVAHINCHTEFFVRLLDTQSIVLVLVQSAFCNYSVTADFPSLLPDISYPHHAALFLLLLVISSREQLHASSVQCCLRVPYTAPYGNIVLTYVTQCLTISNKYAVKSSLIGFLKDACFILKYNSAV